MRGVAEPLIPRTSQRLELAGDGRDEAGNALRNADGCRGEDKSLATVTVRHCTVGILLQPAKPYQHQYIKLRVNVDADRLVGFYSISLVVVEGRSARCSLHPS
jgi:hypothetical protein